MYVYEGVDNYRANGTPLWSAAVFHKSRAFTGDSPRHVFFFFFFILFCFRCTKQIRAFFGRRGQRICFAAGCSALFAVLSWHFENVSDFVDYPENVFRDHLQLVVQVLRHATALHLIMIEDATLLAERSARAANLKSIKYNPLRDVMVARPRCVFKTTFSFYAEVHPLDHPNRVTRDNRRACPCNELVTNRRSEDFAIYSKDARPLAVASRNN